MRLTQWVEGQVVEWAGMSFTITDVTLGRSRKGYAQVIATADGEPVNILHACDCTVREPKPQVFAVDLVTENMLVFCKLCRGVRL